MHDNNTSQNNDTLSSLLRIDGLRVQTGHLTYKPEILYTYLNESLALLTDLQIAACVNHGTIFLRTAKTALRGQTKQTYTI